MPIFERFFRSRSRVLPTKCPTCGKVSDFQFDTGKREIPGKFELDPKTHMRVLECPYCSAGMLLCIRDGRLIGIEPFTDDPPADVLAAVALTRAKLGL